MSNIGMGVMLRYLAGDDDSSRAWQQSVGKTIERIAVFDDELTLEFSDHSRLVFKDRGQECCESRYMTCDDDLQFYRGSTLVNAEIKNGPTSKDEWGDPHDIEFLEIVTNKGAFTVANHNEHNGYYGGFSIECRVEG